jgi:hypothetical protein
MRRFIWWISRDKEGRKRIERAKAENEEIAKRLEQESKKDRDVANSFREIRRINHLAELFEEAFGRGQD